MLAAALCACSCGCTQRMAEQPRLEPLEASRFFEDHMASRHFVPGTVSRGYEARAVAPAVSPHFRTGMVDGELATELPPDLDESADLRAVLERGQQRYAIFCSHCHDLVGTGRGMVPQRGFPEPPTYHSERLRAAPIGHFFAVISNGKGPMPAHRTQIPPADRWAIAAYVRALQFSQHADASLLSAGDTSQLEASP